jgi:hypothetical protein
MVSALSTYDQTPPKRPEEIDLLNGAKQNTTATVPPHMPAAEEYMQIARQAMAASRMAAVLRFRLPLASTAGVPIVDSFSSVRGDLGLGDLVTQDLGVGWTRITWPAGRLPPSISPPEAFVHNVSAPIFVGAIAVSNGVEVRTWDAAGVAIDADVSLAVY